MARVVLLIDFILGRHHRAHEQAFQHWENPGGNDAAARDGDPLSEPVQSFRVYSAAQLQNVAMRPGTRPGPEKTFADEVKETLEQVTNASPQKIARFIGIGVGTTILLFAGIIGLANATDDTLSIPKQHSNMLASKAKMEANNTPPPSLRLPPSSPAAAAAAPVAKPTDFELPDQNTPSQRTATVKGRAPKQGKRSVGNGMTIRTAPF